MSDPLSTKNVNTNTPLIADKHACRFKLTKFEPGQTDNGPILKLRFDLQEPAPSNQDGITIMPNTFPGIFMYTIFMYAKPGSDPTHFVGKICEVVDALLGTDQEGNPKGKPTRPEVFLPGRQLVPRSDGGQMFQGAVDPELIGQLVGKILVAKMRITKDKRDDSLRNEFGDLFFPEDFKG